MVGASGIMITVSMALFSLAPGNREVPRSFTVSGDGVSSDLVSKQQMRKWRTVHNGYIRKRRDGPP